MQESIVDRFCRYARIHTQSDENSNSTPSTACQWDLARLLQQELQALGLSEVHLDDRCYLYALLPANTENKTNSIGLIAHIDTAPAVSGKNVQPRLVNQNGEDCITSDGNTLLGADDKAGIAAILHTVETLVQHPEIRHGAIYLAFTPDEEIGRGADYFDRKRFQADWAYTVDGGALGELECENFCAAGAVIHIQGRNVHPGYAKGKMRNSQWIAMQVMQLLTSKGLPENTEGKQGFYHLDSMQGTVEHTELHILLRDFRPEGLEQRKVYLRTIQAQVNACYGADCMQIDIHDQYANMLEKIKPYPFILELAQKAMHSVQVIPMLTPIRGGTDGARLSFMGLPCPNLFAGGLNFHSKDEYLPVVSLQKAADTLLALVVLTAQEPYHSM